MESPPRHPVAGIDYPRTFQEFDAWFGSETACREYIQRLRWPDGFVCPHCAAMGEPWEMARSLLRCRGCDRQGALTAGNGLRDARKPLRMWFLAMWFVTSQKNGVSALGLQRVLGLGSYKTAWTWLHKLRRAMGRPGREMIGGPGKVVEVDETIIGGVRSGQSGRHVGHKIIVVIAVEVEGKGAGRVRMARIP